MSKVLAGDCYQIQLGNDIYIRKDEYMFSCGNTNIYLNKDDNLHRFNKVYIKGHNCIETHGDIHTWCNNDICKKLTLVERQRLENETVSNLIKAGHTCVQVFDAYPSQHTWCKKVPCVNNHNFE